MLFGTRIRTRKNLCRRRISPSCTPHEFTSGEYELCATQEDENRYRAEVVLQLSTLYSTMLNRQSSFLFYVSALADERVLSSKTTWNRCVDVLLTCGTQIATSRSSLILPGTGSLIPAPGMIDMLDLYSSGCEYLSISSMNCFTGERLDPFDFQSPRGRIQMQLKPKEELNRERGSFGRCRDESSRESFPRVADDSKQPVTTRVATTCHALKFCQ